VNFGGSAISGGDEERFVKLIRGFGTFASQETVAFSASINVRRESLWMKKGQRSTHL
jgi:hypothetical protein